MKSCRIYFPLACLVLCIIFILIFILVAFVNSLFIFIASMVYGHTTFDYLFACWWVLWFLAFTKTASMNVEACFLFF